MHYILKNTSLRCTSLSNNMYGWNIQYFQRESFLLPLVRHHSHKNEQYAIQGCNTPSRKCTAYSWRIQSNFVQYSLQPIISFERGSNCAEHAINLSNTCLYFYIFTKVTVHNSLQKAELFSRCMIFSKKLVQDTAIFSGSTFFSSFSCAFMYKVYWFPASVLLFFQQGSAFKAKYRWCLETV